MRIFAEAFGQDVKFFDFYRSLQAYRTAFADGVTSFVMKPDSPFFRYFGTPPIDEGTPPAAPAPAGTPLSAAPVPTPGQAAAAQP